MGVKCKEVIFNPQAPLYFIISGGTLSITPQYKNGKIVSLVPDLYIDTTWAYKNYKYFLDSPVEQVNFAGFLERERIPFELFENDFEAIVVPTYPEIGEIKDTLRAQGARFASLSGSGSTVYGIFDDEADAVSAESPLTTSYSTFITGPHL